MKTTHEFLKEHGLESSEQLELLIKARTAEVLNELHSRCSASIKERKATLFLEIDNIINDL